MKFFEDEAEYGVQDLQWDPNSSNYLLACWDNGII